MENNNVTIEFKLFESVFEVLEHLGLKKLNYIFQDKGYIEANSLIYVDDFKMRQMLIPAPCRRAILRYSNELKKYNDRKRFRANNSIVKLHNSLKRNKSE